EDRDRREAWRSRDLANRVSQVAAEIVEEMLDCTGEHRKSMRHAAQSSKSSIAPLAVFLWESGQPPPANSARCCLGPHHRFLWARRLRQARPPAIAPATANSDSVAGSGVWLTSKLYRTAPNWKSLKLPKRPSAVPPPTRWRTTGGPSNLANVRSDRNVKGAEPLHSVTPFETPQATRIGDASNVIMNGAVSCPISLLKRAPKLVLTCNTPDASNTAPGATVVGGVDS